MSVDCCERVDPSEVSGEVNTQARQTVSVTVQMGGEQPPPKPCTTTMPSIDAENGDVESIYARGKGGSTTYLVLAYCSGFSGSIMR